MDRWDWLLVVAAVVLGQFALLGIEFLRSQLERWQRKQDRRDDFDREALIGVQTHLNRMARAGSAIFTRRQMIFDETGEWTDDYSYQDAEPMTFMDGDIEVAALAGRIKDDQTRALILQVHSLLEDSMSASTKDEFVPIWPRSRQLLNEANDRIGEQLRSH